jgi:hypothetical protein
MKLSELPPDTQLGNTKVRVPDNIKLPTGMTSREVYIKSVWSNGLWLKGTTDQDGRIFPLGPFDPIEACDWEVV